jgi:ferredoxin
MIEIGATLVLDRAGLDSLVSTLSGRGYRTMGPVLRDGAIVNGPITGVADLPEGWHDVQGPGSYRLHHDAEAELFGWSVGPQSWKAAFLPASETLWRTSSADPSTVFEPQLPDAPLAIIGARACDLAGIALLDRVMLGGAHVDQSYEQRRSAAFIVVAECTTPGATCFCASMDSGPQADSAFDLALIELRPSEGYDDLEPADDEGHVARRAIDSSRFLVRVGSEQGAAVLESLPSRRPATSLELQAREELLTRAIEKMGRTLETAGLQALLARNIDNSRWEAVAQRCLSCGNCTMVCPSCFCTDLDDVTDLVGGVERERHWASCFDLQHSYLHGGAVRNSGASRYRQWAVHKLSSWHDQFGTSGCVGCGRCITWCPVGIDITEEVAEIRATDGWTQPDSEGTEVR